MELGCTLLPWRPTRRQRRGPASSRRKAKPHDLGQARASRHEVGRSLCESLGSVCCVLFIALVVCGGIQAHSRLPGACG
eukprot:2267813-Pleurochrysis_carterae.AAC.1